MLLFIEGYPYELNHEVKDGLTVRDVLKDVVEVPKLETNYAFGYVGYCYSKATQDVIFFLPKVVLTGETDDENKADTIFGAHPEEIIDFDSENVKSKFTEEGSKEYQEFLSTLSIWIYRTISVYKETNDGNILESKEYRAESRGKRSKHNTLLDVIIALRDFNRENQDYFTFIAKNIHSGYNKIQWNKTITKTTPVFVTGAPVYVNPVNKKKVINFDEELLVIFFSILNFIKEEHGFAFQINIFYELISPRRIKRLYIEKKYGCRRLRQIKYKYFSDMALRIWDLCYAFFDKEYEIAINRSAQDYLLARDFEHIFEVMIDTLIGGNDKKKLPKELIEQRDGKLVDHMYIGQGLIEQSNLPAELTYYIGDSKYYKRAKDDTVHLGEKSIYKQYTYAKNVIQWNMNLFLDGDDKSEQPQLRDKLTEGYNPIPNFFISARIPNKKDGGKFLKFDDFQIVPQTDRLQYNRQFENRLFDRDTLLLCHYDVNFLFIVSLYGRANKNKQAQWRDYVRAEFRSKIQQTLNRLYTFRIIQPRVGMDCYKFLQENFSQLNGKLYRSGANKNYLVLALMKGDDDGKRLWKNLNMRSDVIDNETIVNKDILEKVKSHFYVSDPFTLETELPIEATPGVGTLEPLVGKPDSKDLVLVGYYKTEQLNCILKAKLYYVPVALGRGSINLVTGFENTKYLLLHQGKAGRMLLYLKGNGPKFYPKAALEELGFAPTGDYYLGFEIKTTIPVAGIDLDNYELERKGRLSYTPYFTTLDKLQPKE